MTALIASLYREQRQAEDRAIFDAWQNGGMFQGKPVTDERLRGYIIARRDSLKGDVLYDEWNNRLIQIDFKIGEDKIQLAFQQGKVGAGAVASYYRGQLNKIPKNSAFYREVASRAAQWSKAAGSAARGRARSRLAGALDSKIKAADRQMADADAVNDIVRRAAVRAGLINDNEAVTDADASRLQALFDAGIVGPKGTTVTFDDWRGALMSAYQTFDQRISINEQLNRGTKTLKEDKAKFFQGYILGTNAIDDRVKYEAARDVWLEAVQDAAGDPRAILAANEKYAASLEKISKDASAAAGNDATPDEFIGGLQNEINAVRDGKYTGPGVVDFYRRSDADDFDGKLTEGDDTASSAESFVRATDDAKALANGTAYYGQSEFGGPMSVVRFPPGSEFDPFGRNGLGPDSQQAIVTINGKPTSVVLKGKPVESTGLVNANGDPVEMVPGPNGSSTPVSSLSASQVQSLLASGAYALSEESQTVGYVFQSGGKTTYGYIDPASGDIKFTATNPFGGAMGLSEGGLTLVSASTLDAEGNVVVAPPVLTNVDATGKPLFGDDLIVDPGISPRDLRNLAMNADEQTGAQLAALADKRQADAQAEADFMARSAGQEKTQAGLSQLIRNATSMIDQAFNAATDAARKAGDTAPPTIGLTSRIPLPTGAPPPTTSPSGGLTGSLLGAGATQAPAAGAGAALFGAGSAAQAPPPSGAGAALLGAGAGKAPPPPSGAGAALLGTGAALNAKPKPPATKPGAGHGAGNKLL